MGEVFDPLSKKARFHIPRIMKIRALWALAGILCVFVFIASIWLFMEKKRHKAAKLLNDINYCVKDNHIVVRRDLLANQYGQYN